MIKNIKKKLISFYLKKNVDRIKNIKKTNRQTIKKSKKDTNPRHPTLQEPKHAKFPITQHSNIHKIPKSQVQT